MTEAFELALPKLVPYGPINDVILIRNNLTGTMEFISGKDLFKLLTTKEPTVNVLEPQYRLQEYMIAIMSNRFPEGCDPLNRPITILNDIHDGKTSGDVRINMNQRIGLECMTVYKDMLVYLIAITDMASITKEPELDRYIGDAIAIKLKRDPNAIEDLRQYLNTSIPPYIPKEVQNQLLNEFLKDVYGIDDKGNRVN